MPSLLFSLEICLRSLSSLLTIAASSFHPPSTLATPSREQRYSVICFAAFSGITENGLCAPQRRETDVIENAIIVRAADLIVISCSVSSVSRSYERVVANRKVSNQVCGHYGPGFVLICANEIGFCGRLGR